MSSSCRNMTSPSQSPPGLFPVIPHITLNVDAPRTLPLAPARLHFFPYDISSFICPLLHCLAQEAASAATALSLGLQSLSGEESMRVWGMRAWFPSCSSPAGSQGLYHALSSRRDQLPARDS